MHPKSSPRTIWVASSIDVVHEGAVYGSVERRVPSASANHTLPEASIAMLAIATQVPRLHTPPHS
jgi:hypothetical protein